MNNRRLIGFLVGAVLLVVVVYGVYVMSLR